MKINYDTQYAKNIISTLDQAKCKYIDTPETIIAVFETPEGSKEFIKEISWGTIALTYQIDHKGIEVTIFNPKV